MFNHCAICIYFKSGGGDGWMNQVSRQFSNMGLLVGLVLIKKNVVNNLTVKLQQII